MLHFITSPHEIAYVLRSRRIIRKLFYVCPIFCMYVVESGIVRFSDLPTDQTFHQFHDLYTELDLHRIMSGFHGAFATGVASQQGTLTLPDTWFRPPFWDLPMLQLLRPNSSNLPYLYSTFHLEYPLVLSRFCFINQLITQLRWQMSPLSDINCCVTEPSVSHLCMSYSHCTVCMTVLVIQLLQISVLFSSPNQIL